MLFDESLGDGAPLPAELENDFGTEAVVPALPPRERLLAALSVTPVDADQIARSVGLASRDFAALVLDLELSGEIERHSGNRLSRKSG
jgi:predicted Rossmann fold nucleotide-binding protein DprA/Smf involved in DNA uptake